MFLRLLSSSWRARRGRLVLALTAVTLGVSVTVALATLALEVGDDLAKSLRAAGPNFVVLPPGGSLEPAPGEERAPRLQAALPVASVARMRSGFWKNNILEAAPELSVTVTLGGRPVTLLGTWFDTGIETDAGPWRTGVPRLHPQWRIAGSWPREGERQLALGAALARSLGAAAGHRVELGRGAARETWRVSGVVEAGGGEDRSAWAPLGEAQRLAGREGEIDRVWMSALVKPMPRRPPPDPAKDPAAYERFMCTAYPPMVAADVAERLEGAEVLAMTEVVAGEGRVVERLNLLMLLLALAALVAAALGLLSTTTATVVERAPELGLLRALGASGGQIAALLLGETLVVALPGGALGWLIGSLAAGAIRGEAFGASAPLHPLLLPLAVGAALALTFFGTLGPLRLAMRLDPVAVLKA